MCVGAWASGRWHKDIITTSNKNSTKVLEINNMTVKELRAAPEPLFASFQRQKTSQI